MSNQEYQAYNPSVIEKKWQEIWEKDQSFEPKDDFTMPKFYGLIEFPYPSGNGLHVGHPRSNTAMDIICRKRRMEGYNVLFPIGWDAFGLPTENYAIKNKIHPEIVTRRNIEHFKAQLKMLGFSFTWSSEVSTTDPEYYHFTQWIFLKLFEKGLAYKAEMPINWCTSCKVGLANEEVVNGVCERCGGEVVRKVKSQWMLRITEYAEKLIDGLDTVDFIEKVKVQQRNWIGRSTGAEVNFRIKDTDDFIRVYTTRPDTLFGATYMVISPEHKLIDKYKDRITNYDAVQEYRQQAARKSEFERTELAKEKTGVELAGITAINPVNNEEIPVWTSDYVLSSYGTGAIMAVPAHDDRDYEFAKKFGIEIVEVVSGGDISENAFTDIETGIMINSGFLNGLSVKDAKAAVTKYLEEQGIGEAKVNFKLRDWVFSRQRYWGEPIPVVQCEKCGYVALPESELPLLLPNIDNYVQTDSGESPLVNLPEWVNTTCPHCGGPAKRETDTMPQWAGSSWYFIRYTDPHNQKELASWDKMKYWLPVDWYNGGMEHTTLHLLYSRFWHKFLYDIGAVPCPEPYQKRTSHGMILGENGEKMSKSRGNVINPDDIVKEIGADAFRLYEMFMGAFDQPIPWSTDGARGCYRFLERVWKLQKMVTDEKDVSKAHQRSVHVAIKKVSEDYEKMKYNTAIAAMMSLVNAFYSENSLSRGDMAALLKLLYPVCPHFAEELWQKLGLSGRMIHEEKWPEFDESKLALDEVEIAVQILGKIKLRINVPASLDRDALAEYALSNDSVKELIAGKQVRKVIAVPGSLVNIIC
ncbi:MAG: leucine--tRNA ligase [Clostridia bacterium]|nr:leucine--tRNA ligase [Clostridia bacterium]